MRVVKELGLLLGSVGQPKGLARHYCNTIYGTKILILHIDADIYGE